MHETIRVDRKKHRLHRRGVGNFLVVYEKKGLTLAE